MNQVTEEEVAGRGCWNDGEIEDVPLGVKKIVAEEDDRYCGEPCAADNPVHEEQGRQKDKEIRRRNRHAENFYSTSVLGFPLFSSILTPGLRDSSLCPVDTMRTSARQPENLIDCRRMSRSVHIAAALVGVLVVLRPVDCFSATGVTREAIDCCKKGKCFPTKDSDRCCKKTIPDGQQFVAGASKAQSHSPTAVVGIIAPDTVRTLPMTYLTADLLSNIHSPPGASPQFRVNLPLLI